MEGKCLGCHVIALEKPLVFCSYTCCFLAGYGNVREGVNRKAVAKLMGSKELRLKLLNNPPVRVRDRNYRN